MAVGPSECLTKDKIIAQVEEFIDAALRSSVYEDVEGRRVAITISTQGLRLTSTIWEEGLMQKYIDAGWTAAQWDEVGGWLYFVVN